MKVYFFKFTYNLFFCNTSSTSCKCIKCSSSERLYINMSSKYTTTNFPIKGFSTWFINLMKVLGALLNPNGITSHSYNPSFVLNADFHYGKRAVGCKLVFTVKQTPEGKVDRY